MKWKELYKDRKCPQCGALLPDHQQVDRKGHGTVIVVPPPQAYFDEHGTLEPIQRQELILKCPPQPVATSPVDHF